MVCFVFIYILFYELKYLYEKGFVCFISLPKGSIIQKKIKNSTSSPTLWFYRSGNWDPAKWNNLPKVISSGAFKPRSSSNFQFNTLSTSCEKYSRFKSSLPYHITDPIHSTYKFSFCLWHCHELRSNRETAFWYSIW